MDLTNAFVRELDGRIVVWSGGAAAMYGWTAAEAMGAVSHDLLRARYPWPLDQVHAALLRTGHWEGELYHRHRDGRRLRVASICILQHDGDGRPTVIELNHDISRFTQAQQSQRYLAAIVQSSDDPIIGKTLDGIVTSWNRAAETVLGWSAADLIGRSIAAVVPPDLLDEEAMLRARISAGEQIQHQQTRRLRRDGEEVPVSLTMSPIHDDDGVVIGVSTILRDVTAQRRAEQALQQANDTLEQRVAERTRELADQLEARRQAEAALAQAQKMEAVGQLTGGVAHDFNNLLTVIAGNLHFISQYGEREPRLRRLAASTLGAVERGARLTSRLLAFARRQTLQPEVLRLDTVVHAFSGLIVRAIGESVRVKLESDRDLWHAEVDPSQFEGAVLNLAINARDAMPDGGLLAITVRNAADPKLPDLAPGRYVCVTVADDGEGMSGAVAARAVEPFFTTKEVGKGSGLGLSQAYGFARQSGGALHIDSEPGRGTRVSMYFPASAAPLPTAAPHQRLVRRRSARVSTVLVVEDDPQVLELVEEALREDGHAVITAADGREALAALELHPEVDAMVSDVTMPNGISGVALGHQARRVRPDLAVLLMSGYPRDELNGGAGTDGFAFLPKPFRPADLVAQLQDLLAATV